MTTHGVALAASPDDTPDIVASWTGRQYDEVHRRIVDDTGTDVPLGAAGQNGFAGLGRPPTTQRWQAAPTIERTVGVGDSSPGKRREIGTREQRGR
jgi:hypothetical protein